MVSSHEGQSADMINDNADEERSALQKAIDAIDAFDDYTDISGLARIVAGALPGLELAEAAILTDHVKARTGISQPAARALLKDAENYREGHGFLRTPRQVAEAYLRLLAQHYLVVKLVGQGLYAYAPSAENPDTDDGQGTGFFERTSLNELVQHLTDTFDDLPLLRSARGREEVLVQLRLRCADDGFFADAPTGVNLRNGFLQMDEAGNVALLPHSPEHKARMRLEVDYDPNADPAWLEAAFAITLPEEKARMALQEVAGSILFGVRPSNDSVRNMTILLGASGSGKSTIISMLTGLLPKDVVGSVPPEHWGEPNYRAALENVALNVVTELGTAKLAGEHVKKIVSCEPIIVRRMRRDPVVITPNARHLFAGNVVPGISDKTDAIARRINVISFRETLTASQVDSGLLQRVQADPNALLAFAMKGAKRLVREGAFTKAPGQDLAIAEMQHGHDPLLLFAHTQVRRNPGGRITTTALQSALAAFVNEREIDPPVITNGSIKRVAAVFYRKYGATRHTTNGMPFYNGVSLISQTEPDREGPANVDLGDL
jgi:energy-coupling factor transporter ATP-binding protein EcfA2